MTRDELHAKIASIHDELWRLVNHAHLAGCSDAEKLNLSSAMYSLASLKASLGREAKAEERAS